MSRSVREDAGERADVAPHPECRGSSPARLIHLFTTIRRSGIMHNLHNLVRDLDRSRFEPMILSIDRMSDPEFESEFHSIGVATAHLDIARGRFVPSLAEIRRRILAFEPRIVHSHGIRPDFVNALLRGSGVVRLSTLHNHPFGDYPNRYGRGGYLLAAAHLLLLRQMPVISVTSQNSRLLSSRGSAVIHNGVDLAAHSIPDPSEKLRLRRVLGLEGYRRVFLSVGHLIPLKDPETTCRGFLASGEAEDGLLLLLGDGSLLSELSRKYAGTNIRFAGRITRVRDYYRATDAFISSSLTEGNPNAVLEAIATGLPVYLSRIPGHAEILGLDPSWGALFDKGSSAALAAAIDDKGLGSHEGPAGPGRSFVEEFSSGSMARRYQDLYNDQLAGRSSTD